MCHVCGNANHVAEWLETDNQGATTNSTIGYATGASTVTATGVTDVDGLLGGVKWNNLSVDFNFPGLQSYYVSPYGLATGRDGVTTADLSTGFQAVSESFKTMTRHALSEFAAVTNLTFNEVGASATSNISIARTTQLGSATAMGFGGYGYFPGSSQRAGDIWFASSTADVGDSFVLGRGTYMLVLHELGHAMGLKHGHQAGGVANTTMTAAHDFNDYSIMSYRRELGGSTSPAASEAFGRAQSLMMYDILALQTMYGANYTTNAGNTVYSFSTTTGQMFTDGVGDDIPGNGAANSNRIYRTLWDGGGVDTYDFSNYATALNVDLTPGGKSTLDQNQLAVVNNTTGGKATGNLFNALQFQGSAASLIENAIGGSGGDTITGNAADNNLQGRGGVDTLNGGLGSDTLDGGTGADTMNGGDGTDFYHVDNALDVIIEGATPTSGFDYVIATANYVLPTNVEQLILQGAATVGTGNSGNNVLYGLNSSLSLTLDGMDGDDVIYGSTAGSNTLTGGAGVDTLLAYGGNNAMRGGLGSDIYYTYTATDTLSETGGDGIDTVYAVYTITVGEDLEQVLISGASAGITSTSADDNNIFYGNSASGPVTLNGGGGADVLFGGANGDTLNGGAGVDLLFGNGGADALAGGDDTDIYYLTSGTETITETGAGGFDTAYTNAASPVTMAANLEQLILYGAASTGIGNGGDNYIYGHIASAAVTLDGAGGHDYLLDSVQSGDMLIGGAGNDQLDLRTGGNDFIRYASAGFGADVVFGFDADATGGQDLIDVRGTSASIVITASGSDTLITMGADTIVLVGVASGNVTTTDFVF